MKNTLSMFIALSLLGASLTVAAAEPATGPAAPKQDEATKPASKPEAAQPAAKSAATDRVELNTTQITGNRELPRVLYVVPWKRADLGDVSGKPARSLLDEVLAPVDRDVFRRQNRYHDALQPDSAGPRSEPGPDNRGVER
jgi:hypothetical protein